MRQIISVSRRTDIPAFYGYWFLNRVKEGFCGYINPFGGQRYIIPLQPEHVICFVFWSKNYSPFITSLEVLRETGYKFYFNFTLTGLPSLFEDNLCSTEQALVTMKTLSTRYSPEHINWRYDPILVSDSTPYNFHRENFKNLARSLKGYVKRCYFSFAVMYGKVRKNFDLLEKKHGIHVRDPEPEERLELALELADIALENDIHMYSCCGDYLAGDTIKKARCVDGELIEHLFYTDEFSFKQKPTRKGCGCTESRDIGVYDSCPHGCVYCYANMNREKAGELYTAHDPRTAFLGHDMEQADRWITEIREREFREPGLFDE